MPNALVGCIRRFAEMLSEKVLGCIRRFAGMRYGEYCSTFFGKGEIDFESAEVVSDSTKSEMLER
jgi:hypothetical protein